MKKNLIALLLGITTLSSAQAAGLGDFLQGVLDETVDVLWKREHQFQSIPEEELLQAEWSQISATSRSSIFVRVKDIQNHCSKGLWTRTVPNDGSAEVFEHFHTDCSGNNTIIRDAEIKVSVIDGSLQRRSKDDRINDPDNAASFRNLLCSSGTGHSSKQASRKKNTRSRSQDDFTTVEYCENGRSMTLESCNAGRRSFTTFEQLKGKSGGSTDIAACETSNDFAPWLAVKRQDFNIVGNSRQTTAATYRIGQNCTLIDAGSGAQKWDCRSLRDVESIRINTVIPITDRNRNQYFVPIWVKANKTTASRTTKPVSDCKPPHFRHNLN